MSGGGGSVGTIIGESVMIESEYVKRRDEVVGVLPPEFREAVLKRAWDEGHSCGYEEVLLVLKDLVDDLVGPLAVYRSRVVGSALDELVK